MGQPTDHAVQDRSVRRRLPWAGLIALLIVVAFAPAIVDVIVLKTTRTGYFPDQTSVNHLGPGTSDAATPDPEASEGR